MKISVVIPVYNEEKNIGRCLEGLSKQEVKPDEIIVVDNNCTDKTVLIAQKYGVRIIKEKIQGMIPARNTGYSQSQGDIIARTDADTILPPDWIKKIKKNFESNHIDALTGRIKLYDLPLNQIPFDRIYYFFLKLIQGNKETVVGPNMALTKSIWNKVKNHVCLNDKIVHEDIDLGIHINKVGGYIKRDNSLVVHASGRRIKDNPTSFFIEYPKRLITTFLNH